VIEMASHSPAPEGLLVRARVHDRKSPSLATEWREVVVQWTGEGSGSAPMQWYGEYLWRATVPAGAVELELCATDAAGGSTCVPVPAAGV